MPRNAMAYRRDPPPKMGLPQSGVNAPPTESGMWAKTVAEVMGIPYEMAKENINRKLVTKDGNIDQDALLDMVMGMSNPLGVANKVGKGLGLAKAASKTAMAEKSDLLTTIRSLQTPGQPRELVSISKLREAAGEGGLVKLDASSAKYIWIDKRKKDKAKLGDVLDWPELYDMFPKLKDRPVRFVGSETGSGFTHGFGGEFLFYEHGEHKIWPEKKYSKERAAVKKTDDDQNISDLLHEIQHWVQEREGNTEWTDKGKTYAEYLNHPREIQSRNSATQKNLVIKDTSSLDSQLLDLARQGKVVLHKGDYEPGGKGLVVENPSAYRGKEYYVGVVPKTDMWEASKP